MSNCNSSVDYKIPHETVCKPLLFSASIGSGPLDIELKTKHHYNSLEVDSGFCGDASLQSTSSVGSGGYSSGGIGTYTSSSDSRRSRDNCIYFNAYHCNEIIVQLFFCKNVNGLYFHYGLMDDERLAMCKLTNYCQMVGTASLVTALQLQQAS
jgi:hypothetical protein